jgi:hypothetical protein
MAITFKDGLSVSGASTFSSTLKVSSIANASTDTDKILVSDGGVIKYRTGAQILSDIGAGQGTVTSITAGTGLSGGTITSSGTIAIDSTVVRTTGTQTVGGAKTLSNTLTLMSVAESEEATKGLVLEGNIVTYRELGDNAFNSDEIPTTTSQLTNNSGFLTSLSGAVLTTGNQTIAGQKYFSDSTAGVQAKYKSYDGSAGLTSTVYVRNAAGSNTTVFTIKNGIITGITYNSDRRLKKNIKLVGKSPSGINIYEFRYKDTKYGVGRFQGVMSDEVPWRAVTQDKGGYDMVDYSLIDVEFKRVK